MSRDIEEMESSERYDSWDIQRAFWKRYLKKEGLATLASGSNEGLLLQGELDD